MQRSHWTDPTAHYPPQHKSDQKRDGCVNKSEEDCTGGDESGDSQKWIEMKKNFHSADGVLSGESGLKEQEKEQDKKDNLCNNS